MQNGYAVDLDKSREDRGERLTEGEVPGRPNAEGGPGTRAASVLRLLRTAGFLVETVHLGQGFVDCLAVRHDEFGTPINYVLGVLDGTLNDAVHESLKQIASRERAALLVVADNDAPGTPTLTWAAFVARMGGSIPSLLPLDPRYRDRLMELGRGRRPEDLADGEVDELYEKYVHAGLEFLLGSRVIQYGATRLFKPVPDGLMLPIGEQVAFLYDAKAYNPSFEVTRDDLRRFADYVRHYTDQYAHHSGRARGFLVVSTEFSQSVTARRRQSDQLLADVGVPLSFMTSEDLAGSVALLAQRPWARNALRWTEIMATLDVTTARIRAALAEVQADRVRV